MKERLVNLREKAAQKHAENRRFFAKLKKKPPKDLDDTMCELHDKEFRQTDCLACANCCKTTGPLFTGKDIERLAKHLKMKPGQFVNTYLEVDEENDYVLQKLPCAFLGADNRCLVYEVRPRACREFPHTNRKKFHQISKLTLKNVGICPAAYAIVEEMKDRIPL